MSGVIRRTLIPAIIFPCVFALRVQAQLPSPFPQYSDDRVFVSETADDYSDLRQVIRQQEAGSDRRYRVAVIRTAGSGEFATRDYAFELDRLWEIDARRFGLNYPQDNRILIVLGLENRQLSVVPAKNLQDAWGFRDDVIDRELVQPFLLPYARRQEYQQGLIVLLQEFERWFAAKQSEADRAQQPLENAATGGREREEVPSVAVSPEPDVAAPNLSSPPQFPREGLVVAGMLIVSLAGAAFWWVIHRRRQAAKNELAAFKTQAVALSERIDALNERHRMLLKLDQDFTEPIIGRTLDVYEAAQHALSAFRERWLSLMDAWQQADELIDAGGRFGSENYRRASDILSRAAAPELVQELEATCAADLDRLEQAHETCAAGLEEIRQQQESVNQTVSRLGAAGVPEEPFRGSFETITAIIDAAVTIQTADPLGAQDRLAEARQLLGAALRRADDGIRLLEELRMLDAAVGEQRGVIDDHRSRGLKLQEPDECPDAPFAEAERQRAEGWETLQRGDTDGAAVHLDRARSLVTEVQELVRRTIAARDLCQHQTGVVAAEFTRLRDVRSRTAVDRRHLEAEFDPATWAGVADSHTQADGLIRHAEHQLEDAHRLADRDVQHYVRAAALLTAVRREQEGAAEACEAVSRRLQELQAVRDHCRVQMRDLQGTLSDVRSLLAGSSADRVRANERFRTAERQFQELSEMTQRSRPDWPGVSDRLRSIEHDLIQAREMAQEDIRLARQAEQEIRDAEQAIRRAESFYGFGISPDVTPAGRRLYEARQLLTSGQYEAAIEGAVRAQHEARDVYDAAVRMAQQREEALRIQQQSRLAQPVTSTSAASAPRVPVQPQRSIQPAAPAIPAASGQGISTTDLSAVRPESPSGSAGASQSQW